MKRRLEIILAMVLVLASMGVSAHAMPVRFEDESFAATAALLADGTEFALQADALQLLGTDEDGNYLVFVDGQFMKLAEDAAAPILEGIGGAAATLPKTSDYQPLARRDRGEAVEKLQNSLIALGYIEGEADGSFGGQSQRAVSAFQAAMGLEETGEADEALQMLMDSMQAEEIAIAPKPVPKADAFDVISGKTESNLEDAIDLGMALDYDDITGIGMIVKGEPIAYNVPAQSDIERRGFEARFALRAVQNDDGEVVITPVLEVVCTGVQRPIMQEFIIKSGDERHTLPVETLDSGLSGLMAVETARATLDDETVELLANAADEGELKLRVGCKYGDYDIDVTGENLRNASQVGEAALGLDR